MSNTWQLSRHGNLWLLLAFAAATVPLLRFLPLWLGAVGGIAILWRLGIYGARVGTPGRWLKVALVLLCLAGLLVSFGRFDGLEPMVSLLVSAYALKLLEMRDRREALLTVFLGYFAAVVHCLFDQSFATASVTLAALVVVTAALASLHQGDVRRGIARPLTKALSLVAQALPLMLVLFLVMPRLGPLWTVPGPGSARTGISDTLAPGDVTRLGRSAQVAFRVQFEGPMPPRQQLYWRGLTLSHFDGRSWSRASRWGLPQRLPADRAPVAFPAADSMEENHRYSVVLERTGENWLYGLAVPQPENAGVSLARDYTLAQARPVNSRTGYTVRSWPQVPMDGHGLEHWQWLLETRLPPEGNPRTRAVAQAWRAQTPEPEALLARMLTLFNETFVYTLEPPALGSDSVDDFLWTTQSGFCEHFASAFVFFARAAGIPARVVIGYLGGEVHPGGYLIVRQYDAHAWAEVWLEGRGWVRVDPTAAVAPERIRTSLLDLFGDEPLFFADSPLSLMRLRDVAWVNSVRLRLDEFEYAWSRWVLGYENIQLDLLQRLLGRVEPARLALLLGLSGLLALVPVLLVSLWPVRERRQDPSDRHYLAFCAAMARLGLPRLPGETVSDFAVRCARHHPVLADRIHAIARAYQDSRYGGNDAAVDVLAREVSALRRTLLLKGTVRLG